MPRILHLSDLHLSDVVLDDPQGSYKTDCIPPAERLNLRKSLKWTLGRWVDEVKGRGKLDALVISGDITVADKPDGWNNFSELLDLLLPILPNPNRIVVVPGNHDVARDVNRNAHEHYKNFIEHIRKRGFITPLLEGVDAFDDVSFPDLSPHIVADVDHGWAIVPINSSEYCGVREPIDPIQEPEWDAFIQSCSVGEKQARAISNKLRIQDMARISWPQMCAIHALRNEAVKIIGSEQISLIGVLHHQLLPVDTVEEVKPYEALTNLGHFREVLADNKFNLILHGHKHVGRVFVDHITPRDHGIESHPHRLIIVSSPALAYAKSTSEPLFRELEILGTRGSPTIMIQDVNSVQGGTSLQLPTRYPVRSWQVSTNLHLRRSAGIFIEGETHDEVYDKALSIFIGKARDEELQNITCRVASGSDSPTLPASYPSEEVAAIAGEDNWLGRIVDWWQKSGFEKLALNGVFNHGTRLYGNGGKALNQIHNIIEILAKEPDSSRGIATLVDPYSDNVNNSAINFPSFCFVQFVLVEQNHQFYVDVIAYFRKQEIKFWWPVNYAELSSLQGRVLAGLRAKDMRYPLNRGTITTIAARAKKGAHVPNIMIPEADMILENMGDDFWIMTYALCQPNILDRNGILEKWEEVCVGLSPAKSSSKEFVAPTQCLEALTAVAKPFAVYHDNIRRLDAEWQMILTENNEINEKQNLEKTTGYDSWSNTVSASVDRIRAIVDAEKHRN